jgi:hypothetical protein
MRTHGSPQGFQQGASSGRRGTRRLLEDAAGVFLWWVGSWFAFVVPKGDSNELVDWGALMEEDSVFVKASWRACLVVEEGSSRMGCRWRAGRNDGEG